MRSSSVEVALRLDAEQRVVGVGVLVAQVVDVVGGHRLQAGPARQLGQLGQQLALLGQAGVLQLDVDVLAAEELGQTLDLGQGAASSLPSRSSSAARPLMQPVRQMSPSLCSAQQLPVGARLVVVALQVGRRAELHEVVVAASASRASSVRCGSAP